ncbi:MAG: molybdopterin molybdotransferase MoeA [Defluviitaleaceae bacterium]|nr:molybdopterin molybdotransferase MoeA [Defluviitaleaceae bacterium]
MSFLTMKTLHSVLGEMKEKFAHIALECEVVGLGQAPGRVLAADVVAAEQSPGFDRSCVDGYAVVSGDTFGASESVPCFLKVLPPAQMGMATKVSVGRGEAVYVPTGAQIPAGADAVVMVEYCEKLSQDTVAVLHACAPNTNIMYKGDDCGFGGLLAARGTRITPLHIGIMAAAGVTDVPVYIMPCCAIISTGDEIVGLGEPLPLGCIRDVNTHMLGAELEAYGCRVTSRRIVGDSFGEIRAEICRAVCEADIVLISGGTSVGDKDYTRAAIEAVEKDSVFAHGIALKPGKPTIVAKVGGKPVLGLPGQCVSAYIVFKMVVQPFLDSLCGISGGLPHLTAELTANVHSAPGKLTVLAVKLNYAGGKFYADPVHGKSGLISHLMASDGLILIGDRREGLTSGEIVDVVRL